MYTHMLVAGVLLDSFLL